jgi:plasmid stability protein
MAQILIRDLDPKVVEKLKEQAARNGRSLESELRVILEREGLPWALDEKAGRKPAARRRKRAARPRAK